MLLGCALAGHLVAQAQHTRELRGTLAHTLGGAYRFRHDLRALQARDHLRRQELDQAREDLDLQHQALLAERREHTLTRRALIDTTWDLVQARRGRPVPEQGQVTANA